MLNQAKSTADNRAELHRTPEVWCVHVTNEIRDADHYWCQWRSSALGRPKLSCHFLNSNGSDKFFLPFCIRLGPCIFMSPSLLSYIASLIVPPYSAQCECATLCIAPLIAPECLSCQRLSGTRITACGIFHWSLSGAVVVKDRALGPSTHTTSRKAHAYG